MVEERETNDAEAAFRTDGDRHVALFVTPLGRCAVAPETSDGAQTADSEDDGERVGAKRAGDRGNQPTKTSSVVTLLSRAEGAALQELMEVTGWLPHTCRAAITGLRKKGYEVDRTKRDEITCYRITNNATSP